MSKKAIFFFMGVVFFSSYHLAHASLVINEILYSPTTKQWVEIYNDGNSSVDLTKYKILDSGASANGHSISAVAGGSNFINPHSYAVVAKVPDDFGAVSFQLFKSSLGIKAGGDSVILRDTLGIATDNTVTVVENSAVNGNSLQLVAGSWTGRTPTPGVTNEVSASSSTGPIGMGGLVSSGSDNDNSVTQTNTTETKTNSKMPEEIKIKTKITANAVAFAGTPVSFQALAFGHSKEELHFGKYFLNFGDGDSKEIQLINGKQFTHAYFYPGDYVISLEYYANSYGDTPDASDQMDIKVVGADIAISRVGTEADFFVELSNNTAYDADISNWLLASSARKFIFPRNTVIGSKKKMTISSNITHFGMGDKDTLKLMNPQGEAVFAYAPSAAPDKTAPNYAAVVQLADNQDIITDTVNEAVISNEVKDENKDAPKEKTAQDEIIPTPNLPASVISSDAVKESSGNPYVWPMIGTIFVGASAGAVYFVRKKKIVPGAGDNFKILDE